MSDADRSEFDAAIAAARENPEREELWDQVESLAGELDSPDEVAALFREVLDRDLSPELTDSIGERAAGFFEEWFGDDPTELAHVLGRVLELNPEADWAFQRLTLALTESQRWEQLLSVYDRIIDNTSDLARKVELLEEASQVARDMAGDSDKAIAYLQMLLPLKPEDDKLAPALEKLLEKHERWSDLIDLWRTLLDGLTQEERAETHGRIAECYLDSLSDPAQALEAAKEFLNEADDDAQPCALIERIYAFESATSEVRNGALDLLRYQYESTDRPKEFVRVLESAVAVEPEREKDLRSEAAQILAEQGELEAAMQHYSALLASDPGSAATLGQLRQLANRSRNYELFSQGVGRAAENADDPSRRVALLSAAAKARLEELDDRDGAIELYLQALRTEDVAAANILAVGRKLNELLAATERNQERLEVLEKLAAAEAVDSTRKALMGDIARLSDSLGNSEKALSAWRARLELDADDQIALDGTISLLEREEQWSELISALQRRVDSATTPADKRSDLVRLARVQHEKLDAVDAALDVWLQIQSEFGETDETVSALTGLMSTAGRWQELADLLERAAARDSSALLDRLVLLGNAYRDHLEAPGRALDCYDRILRIDPYHELAGQGLQQLLSVESCATKAVEILATTYRNTDNWQGILSLAQARLEQTDDPNKRLGVLREAARIHEQNAEDYAAAVDALAQAFPLAPRDPALESDLARLAEVTNKWDVTVEAYRGALAAVEGDANATGELSARLAAILDQHVGDKEAALASYHVVANLEPANHPAVAAITRIAAGLGRWTDAAAAVIRYTRVRDRIDPSLVSILESCAGERDEWPALVAAISSAIDTETELTSLHAANLQTTIAGWQRDRLSDPVAQEASLTKVLELEPGRLATLRELAELRRQHPSAALYETLRSIAEIEAGDLDVRWEATEVAVEHVTDASEVERALSTLMGRASAAWRGSAPATCSREPRDAVEWTLDELGRRYAESNRASAAFELFVDAARLPFPAETQRSLRIKAATVASDQLHDAGSAIEMYRSILSQAPNDSEALAKLGELYRREGRHAELMSLCQHELGLGADTERTLELRLEIVRLVGEVEKQGARIDALQSNLREAPGHEASIDALTALLTEKKAYGDLFEVLSEQAQKLEAQGDGQRAAQLWQKSAALAESELDDPRRAIEAHRRVVALQGTTASFDALARLYTERGEPDQAVPWLDRLLSATEEDRAPIVMRLARAHIDAGNEEQAIKTLAQARADGDRGAEIRESLAGLYRAAEAWPALAELLTDSMDQVDDATAALYAREAAELFQTRLGEPEKSLPAIERALAAHPDDRDLKVMKARSLRSSGQLEEARELLESLIADFGRRRSKERAAIHVELAYVLQAEENDDRALKEIELASKMDAGNPQLLRRAAVLALEVGKPDKAEKSLRSLLLVVRRNPPGEELDAVGESEVLYELHRIAASREETDKAAELLESAVEAAVQSDPEVARLRRTLLANEEYDVALRALEARLDVCDTDDSRAQLLTNIASILENHKDRREDGLTRRLEALALAPQRLDFHDQAVAAARQAGKVEAYVGRVAEIAGKMKRDADTELAAELWTRLGRLAEHDLEDLATARDYYNRAEATGHDRAEALFALARVANRLGDQEAATRALDELTDMAENQAPSPAQAKAMYRLAEMQVQNDDLRQRGIQMLRRALAVDSKPMKAAAILRTAVEAEPDNAEFLALYEQVSRASGEWEILLDFLERRARLSSATPDQIREAVDLAIANGEAARGEALLERAVAAARNSAEGLAGAVWAAIALCRLHMRDEVQTARALLFEIADLAPAEEVFALGSEMAQGSRDRDPELAAEVLEFLRERQPARREVWLPLTEIYRAVGDRDRFMNVISSTLPTLIDPLERNALRKQSAGYLIDCGTPGEAVDTLRDALLDNPDDLEASAMLEGVLRDSDDDEGLADFLWSRFEEAKERGNPDTMTDVALRLGAQLEDMGSADAVNVYKSALSIAPESPLILHRVISTLHEDDLQEKAQLKERLLAVEETEKVPQLALELFELCGHLGDADGALRALQLGQRRAPTDSQLRDQLESHYREHGMWRELAEMMVIDANAMEDDDSAVARHREAAAIYRDHLLNASAAATVLRHALDRRPGDVSLLLELTQAMHGAGDSNGAAAVLADALDSEDLGNERVDLLLSLASLLAEQGNAIEATRKLEEAYGLDPAKTEPALLASLDQQRETASANGDRESERRATLRLAELAAAGDASERASDLLISWVVTEPQDTEALEMLRDLDTKHERWHGVVAACARLAMVQHGEAQIDAANRLAESANALGDISQARQGLEFVHQTQPENAAIRNHLRALYEAIGEFRGAANLLLADAEYAADEAERYEAYRGAADILVNRLGDAESAIGPAQRAQELRPDDHETTVLLADILTHSGRGHEAAAMLEPAIAAHKRRSPELAALQYRMARIAQVMGDQDTQLAWLKRAFDVDRKNGVIAAELAQLATELQDYDLALKPLRAISLMDTPGPISRTMALLWEAKIEHARGNRAKAELWAKKALREDPEFMEAQEFLSQIQE